MFERFTDRARRAVVDAQEEARLLNHSYIGTEHLLIGLTYNSYADEGGLSQQIMAALGADVETLREQAREVFVNDTQVRAGSHIPFTPRAKKVLELSLRDALQLGHNYIGTEHLLLALAREGGGGAAKIMENLGIDFRYGFIKQVVIYMLNQKTSARVAVAHAVSEKMQPTLTPSQAAEVDAMVDRLMPQLVAQTVAGQESVTSDGKLARLVLTTIQDSRPGMIRVEPAVLELVLRAVELNPNTASVTTGQLMAILQSPEAPGLQK
ncbi:hypothetical protein KDA23_04760 [Candidatus Saccharibacteria bacterium]|nr:hypothetical protein [Candidatus Saccharibacteria bacterium]MCB9821578.1 hypothetical protein [Candidatus Nomurabacteria bacterium]